MKRERSTGWCADAWHDWDSFLPRRNWRDFTLVKLGGEWNHMTERFEAEICLLGLWLRVTYVWGDCFVRELDAMRDDIRSTHESGGAPTQEGE